MPQAATTFEATFSQYIISHISGFIGNPGGPLAPFFPGQPQIGPNGQRMAALIPLSWK
jgi:hypothetical protein